MLFGQLFFSATLLIPMTPMTSSSPAAIKVIHAISVPLLPTRQLQAHDEQQKQQYDSDFERMKRIRHNGFYNDRPNSPNTCKYGIRCPDWDDRSSTDNKVKTKQQRYKNN
ncbi:cell surface glycoprotein [Paenibacillus sp. NAIST15-1]|nr:cell surface glycoprotein [Paenibacillus sp. NAIST15-1]